MGIVSVSPDRLEQVSVSESGNNRKNFEYRRNNKRQGDISGQNIPNGVVGSPLCRTDKLLMGRPGVGSVPPTLAMARAVPTYECHKP